MVWLWHWEQDGQFFYKCCNYLPFGDQKSISLRWSFDLGVPNKILKCSDAPWVYPCFSWCNHRDQTNYWYYWDTRQKSPELIIISVDEKKSGSQKNLGKNWWDSSRKCSIDVTVFPMLKHFHTSRYACKPMNHTQLRGKKWDSRPP